MTNPFAPAQPITDSTTKQGLTKREEFAIRIMAATATLGGSLKIDRMARQAVNAADVLIAALNGSNI